MRTRLPALALVGSLLLTAGCGGSSKTGSNASPNTGSTGVATTSAGSTPSGTRGGAPSGQAAAQLVAGADPICRRLNTRLDAAKSYPRTRQAVIRVAAERASVERAALGELSKLVAPASMVRDWQQILAIRRTVIEDLAKLGGYAAADNKQGEQSMLTSGGVAAREMATTARRDGFKFCGQLG